MTKFLIAISFLLFVGSPFANAEQVYYCTSEFSIGIKKDKKIGKWKSTGFEVQRYTIKFSYDFSKLNGLDKTNWTCKTPYPLWDKYDHIVVCYQEHDAGSVFMFDSRTNRFTYGNINIFGYLGAIKDPDSDAIVAGTCQKF